MELYYVKLGGSAFTYKNDQNKNDRFQEILTAYVQDALEERSLSSEARNGLLKELRRQIESMIRTDVIVSFARTLARWKNSSNGKCPKSFIIILGGGSPAHGAVKVARALQLNNVIYGVMVRQVVGYMAALVTSLLARDLTINYIPPSSWFYWEEEKDGQVTVVRADSLPLTLQDHLNLGIYPVLGGDMILGKNGWSILSGDPIPYFIHSNWLQQSISRDWKVKETIMLSDVGVEGRHAGFYDSDPSDPSAQLITRILVKREHCLLELESGTRVKIDFSELGNGEEQASIDESSNDNSSVDVTGGMLQKIWWQVKLAQKGIPTRILDYRLFDSFIEGKAIPHTYIMAET